jgi:hypothetical protein
VVEIYGTMCMDKAQINRNVVEFYRLVGDGAMMELIIAPGGSFTTV